MNNHSEGSSVVSSGCWCGRLWAHRKVRKSWHPAGLESVLIQYELYIYHKLQPFVCNQVNKICERALIEDSKPNPEHTRHSTNAVSVSRVRELCSKIVINSFSDADCHKTKFKKDEKDCPQLKTEHPTFNNSLKMWAHWPIGWLCVCLERKTVPIGVKSESFFLLWEEQLTSAILD